PRSSTSCTLPGYNTGNPAAQNAGSLSLGMVELLHDGSSPASASTPPFFPTPAKLACLKMSPDRSTPGPLPYHMPRTPSYFGPGKAEASWLAKPAAAASSSL